MHLVAVLALPLHPRSLPRITRGSLPALAASRSAPGGHPRPGGPLTRDTPHPCGGTPVCVCVCPLPAAGQANPARPGQASPLLVLGRGEGRRVQPWAAGPRRGEHAHSAPRGGSGMGKSCSASTRTHTLIRHGPLTLGLCSPLGANERRRSPAGGAERPPQPQSLPLSRLRGPRNAGRPEELGVARRSPGSTKYRRGKPLRLLRSLGPGGAACTLPSHSAEISHAQPSRCLAPAAPPSHIPL